MLDIKSDSKFQTQILFSKGLSFLKSRYVAIALYNLYKASRRKKRLTIGAELTGSWDELVTRVCVIFFKFFVLSASTFRGPKKDLLSSPGDKNLISPIPVTTAQHKNTSISIEEINLPLCTCTLIDRCFVPHTKTKEASLSYHDTIIYAEPILFLSKSVIKKGKELPTVHPWQRLYPRVLRP